MLQTTREGKKTSERGAVMVSTVVTTVAFMKSESLPDISYYLVMELATGLAWY